MNHLDCLSDERKIETEFGMVYIYGRGISAIYVCAPHELSEFGVQKIIEDHYKSKCVVVEKDMKCNENDNRKHWCLVNIND